MVHIGAATLGKRVNEFGATRAGNMTVADFDKRCREEDRLLRDLMTNATASHESVPENEDLLCVHIRKSQDVFSLLFLRFTTPVLDCLVQ